MELVTLNEETNQEEKLIEGWDSLVWSERYGPTGDFQLETGNIEMFLNLLPEQTKVTLRDSTVPMLVETHRIERKKNAPSKLTITGRSFESVLDRRVAMATMSASAISDNWVVNTKTPSDLAFHIIADICIDGVLALQDQLQGRGVNFIPAADFLTSTGPMKDYELTRGNLLAIVQQWLASEYAEDTSTTPDTPAYEPHGIRAIRPAVANSNIGIEIYLGVDRTEEVYFDATRKLLDDGTYLFSKVGSANAAYGIGENMAVRMWEGTTQPAYLDRRVILIDATDASIDAVEALRSHMSVSLAEASETALFDGSINPELSPYLYGRDYGLGDKVRLVGDYGLDEIARVTEYIRSESPAGYKAYPTLVTINGSPALGGP